MLQDVRSDRGSKRMSDDNNSIKVVCIEDLRDCETGTLPVKRGAGYSIANREYLAGGLTAGRTRGSGYTTSMMMIPRSGSPSISSRTNGR